jgi:glycosyltransferase involved in cell wall biosynthesis
MRILVANKFWYRRGGLERVMFDEIALLASAGHEVAHFSMAHPENDSSRWSEFFVPYLEMGQSGSLTSAEKLLAAGRMFHNGEAARRFERLIHVFAPDIIHVHGIHRQISPSILGVARRHMVPVVQTVHDYHHVCPADLLLYRGQEVCNPRRCGKIWYGPAMAGRCVHDSLAASALSAAETSWSRATGVYERGIARFISPSRFMAERMRDGGWSLPVDIVPNPAALGPQREGQGAGFAFVGRLVREKGAEVALAAAREADVKLTIAGEGPLLEGLRSEFPESTFLGRIDGSRVERLMKEVRAVLVPSLVYENASMSVLEAMGAGVPVIASALGGLPELIRDGVEGLLVPPGEIRELAFAMRKLADDDEIAARLGQAAQRRASTVYSPEDHLRGILASYGAALRSQDGDA